MNIRVKTSNEEFELKSKNMLRRSVDILIFNLKALSRKKSIYLMTLLMIGMVIICTSIFVPYADAVGLLYLVYLVLPCLIVLGWTSYNVTSSVLINNIKSTGTKSYSFYLGQFLTIVIVGNIITVFFWPLISLLGNLGFFIPFWGDKFHNDYISIHPLSNFSWLYIIYTTQMYLLVTFATYILLQVLISNITTYYLTVVVLLILTIIFGGVINAYFTVPPGFGGSVIKAFDILGVKGKDYWWNDSGLVVTQDFYDYLMDTSDWWASSEIEAYGGAFPQWMFWPSLFFPYYGAGEFAAKTIGYNACWTEMLNTPVFIDGSVVDISQSLTQLSGDMSWYSWILIDPSKGNGIMWLLVELDPYLIVILYSAFALLIRKIRRD